MSELNIAFDPYDMMLTFSIESENSDKVYKIQMEYSYLDEQTVYNMEDNDTSEYYLFAYNVNEIGKHYCNGAVFELNSMEEKNILNILNNSFIIKNEKDRELLKREFHNVFFFLDSHIDEDFKDALSFNEIF